MVRPRGVRQAPEVIIHISARLFDDLEMLAIVGRLPGIDFCMWIGVKLLNCNLCLRSSAVFTAIVC